MPDPGERSSRSLTLTTGGITLLGVLLSIGISVGRHGQAADVHPPEAQAAGRAGRMRSISPFVILAGIVAAIGAVFLVASLLADTDESAGIEEGVTLNAVVEQPARYEGEQVTVSGEWADNEYFPPEGADEVIVIGDDADETLLVVPRLGVAVPDVDENTVLRVTGVVRLPERGEAGLVEPGGALSTGDGPAPVISATRVELAATADAPSVGQPIRATIEQLLRDPRNFHEAPVVVRGSASRVGGRGFVLSQDGATIFVSASGSELEQLEDGERVRVRGDLARLSTYGADALEQAIRSDPPGDQPRSALELDELPIEVGEPYLLLRTLDGAA